MKCILLFLGILLQASVIDCFANLGHHNIIAQPYRKKAIYRFSTSATFSNSKNIEGITIEDGSPVDNVESPNPLNNSYQDEESKRSRSSTSLSLSNTSIAEDELDELRTSDPLKFVMNQVQGMNIDAVLNTGIIVIIAFMVLNKLALVDSSIMRGWTPAEMAVRIPIDNWLGYSSILQDSPIMTKAVTSATVYTIGDFIAQRTTGTGMGEIDRLRMLRSLIAGLIGHGPLSHFWYEISEDFFNNILHLTQWWSVFPKVALDQGFWGPIWNSTYIIMLGLMKSESLESIVRDIKRNTVPLIISGLKIWPLAHCITYGLIPVENRLLWVDLVEILWVVILATAASSTDDEKAQSH